MPPSAVMSATPVRKKSLVIVANSTPVNKLRPIDTNEPAQSPIEQVYNSSRSILTRSRTRVADSSVLNGNTFHSKSNILTISQSNNTDNESYRILRSMKANESSGGSSLKTTYQLRASPRLRNSHKCEPKKRVLPTKSLISQSNNTDNESYRILRSMKANESSGGSSLNTTYQLRASPRLRNSRKCEPKKRVLPTKSLTNKNVYTYSLESSGGSSLNITHQLRASPRLRNSLKCAPMKTVSPNKSLKFYNSAGSLINTRKSVRSNKGVKQQNEDELSSFNMSASDIRKCARENESKISGKNIKNANLKNIDKISTTAVESKKPIFSKASNSTAKKANIKIAKSEVTKVSTGNVLKKPEKKMIVNDDVKKIINSHSTSIKLRSHSTSAEEKNKSEKGKTAIVNQSKSDITSAGRKHPPCKSNKNITMEANKPKCNVIGKSSSPRALEQCTEQNVVAQENQSYSLRPRATTSANASLNGSSQQKTLLPKAGLPELNQAENTSLTIAQEEVSDSSGLVSNRNSDQSRSQCQYKPSFIRRKLYSQISDFSENETNPESSFLEKNNIKNFYNPIKKNARNFQSLLPPDKPAVDSKLLEEKRHSTDNLKAYSLRNLNTKDLKKYYEDNEALERIDISKNNSKENAQKVIANLLNLNNKVSDSPDIQNTTIEGKNKSAEEDFLLFDGVSHASESKAKPTPEKNLKNPVMNKNTLHPESITPQDILDESIFDIFYKENPETKKSTKSNAKENKNVTKKQIVKKLPESPPKVLKEKANSKSEELPKKIDPLSDNGKSLEKSKMDIGKHTSSTQLKQASKVTSGSIDRQKAMWGISPSEKSITTVNTRHKDVSVIPKYAGGNIELSHGNKLTDNFHHHKHFKPAARSEISTTASWSEMGLSRNYLTEETSNVKMQSAKQRSSYTSSKFLTQGKFSDAGSYRKFTDNVVERSLTLQPKLLDRKRKVDEKYEYPKLHMEPRVKRYCLETQNASFSRYMNGSTSNNTNSFNSMVKYNTKDISLFNGTSCNSSRLSGWPSIRQGIRDSHYESLQHRKYYFNDPEKYNNKKLEVSKRYNFSSRINDDDVQSEQSSYFGQRNNQLMNRPSSQTPLHFHSIYDNGSCMGQNETLRDMTIKLNEQILNSSKLKRKEEDNCVFKMPSGMPVRRQPLREEETRFDDISTISKWNDNISTYSSATRAPSLSRDSSIAGSSFTSKTSKFNDRNISVFQNKMSIPSSSSGMTVSKSELMASRTISSTAINVNRFEIKWDSKLRSTQVRSNTLDRRDMVQDCESRFYNSESLMREQSTMLESQPDSDERSNSPILVSHMKHRRKKVDAKRNAFPSLGSIMASTPFNQNVEVNRRVSTEHRSDTLSSKYIDNRRELNITKVNSEDATVTNKALMNYSPWRLANKF